MGLRQHSWRTDGRYKLGSFLRPNQRAPVRPVRSKLSRNMPGPGRQVCAVPLHLRRSPIVDGVDVKPWTPASGEGEGSEGCFCMLWILRVMKGSQTAWEK